MAGRPALAHPAINVEVRKRQVPHPVRFLRDVFSAEMPASFLQRCLLLLLTVRLGVPIEHVLRRDSWLRMQGKYG